MFKIKFRMYNKFSVCAQHLFLKKAYPFRVGISKAQWHILEIKENNLKTILKVEVVVLNISWFL